MGPPKPPSKLDGGKLEVKGRLGGGCFGEVYQGVETATNRKCAIKFEQKSGKSAPQLEHEYDMINVLRKDEKPPIQGIAEALYFGVEGNFNCLAMEILGKSLEDRVQSQGGTLKAPTVALMAEQVITRIEFLHSKGFVHRDIKPENFMFGIDKKMHHVYIIDFGLSKQYWDKSRGAHGQLRQKLSLTGTARYASINAHLGFEQSRRDDLEAIGHMFLYFLKGQLPWSGLDAKTQEEKYRKICDKKKSEPIEGLTKGYPTEFATYLTYCRNLDFTTRPDYNMLYDLMNGQRNGKQEHEYEWDVTNGGKVPTNSLEALIPRNRNLQQPDDKKPAAGDSGSKGCCTVM